MATSIEDSKTDSPFNEIYTLSPLAFTEIGKLKAAKRVLDWIFNIEKYII